MKKKTFWLLPLLILMLSFAGGCIFSPDDDPEPPTVVKPDVPFPGTKEQLMDNFEDAYLRMDFDAFKNLLHPQYLTILQASTTAQYPDVGEYLELPEELQIHQRMFSSEPLTDPDGAFVPAVSDINFQAFAIQDAWTGSTEPLFPTVDEDHPVERALYDVIFLFDRGQTYSTLKVQGQIEFFVTSRDSFHNGAMRKFYMMRGQRDLTAD